MPRLLVTAAETSSSLAAMVATVDAEPPEYRHKTSPDGMVTVAFTDIEGSTEWMERLGEERWLELMLDHGRLVRGCVGAHGGDAARSTGDGFLLVFGGATAALAFAVDLQQALAGDDLRVRVGMHTGNVFRTGDDLFGRTVVLAARITGSAQGGEVLVSAACREYTEHLRRWQYGPGRELSLKGLVATEWVYPLRWS
jgi:class 3 adenylate cyclase